MKAKLAKATLFIWNCLITIATYYITLHLSDSKVLATIVFILAILWVNDDLPSPIKIIVHEARPSAEKESTS